MLRISEADKIQGEEKNRKTMNYKYNTISVTFHFRVRYI